MNYLSLPYNEQVTIEKETEIHRIRVEKERETSEYIG